MQGLTAQSAVVLTGIATEALLLMAIILAPAVAVAVAAVAAAAAAVPTLRVCACGRSCMQQ
jgi:hypothetical protein